MSSPTGNAILRHAPYFPVREVGRIARYYEQTLGFRCEYSAGEPLEFAIVSRDGCAIMLRLTPLPAGIVPNEKQGGTWDAFFWVRDVHSLCAELRGKGAEIVYGPVIQEYRMEEFAVRDPEGYVLGFGQELE
jgi:catechol 2,3-dioxygenase-like lactoylglutathione lyase family enzyme